MPLHYGKTEIPVLFDNDFCMILNKPSGLPVQGGEGVKVSLDSILSENYSPRPLLVHRLDKDTSGIILVAKNKEAAGFFSALFSGRQPGARVSRQYLGICAGVPASAGRPADQGAAVIRSGLTVRGKEKEAETFYRLLSAGAAGDVSCSLLELELGTGRMHQIRRHLAQLGHPLLGDDKYGNFALNKTLRKNYALKFLLLHASRLVIPPFPPLIPEGLEITAPAPAYFSAFLDTCFSGQ